MYKVVWTPTIGERLCVQREPRNAHDRRAVAVLTSEDTLVGHAPCEISKISGILRIGAYCCPKNQERDGCLKVYRCLKVKGA